MHEVKSVFNSQLKAFFWIPAADSSSFSSVTGHEL